MRYLLGSAGSGIFGGNSGSTGGTIFGQNNVQGSAPSGGGFQASAPAGAGGGLFGQQQTQQGIKNVRKLLFNVCIKAFWNTYIFFI